MANNQVVRSTGQGLIPHDAVEPTLKVCLELWEVDMAAMTPASLRAARDAAEGVIRCGMGRALLQEMARPASLQEIALAAAQIRNDIPVRGDGGAPPARSMAEEIQAIKPPFLALQATVGRLRRTCTFPPAIAEVLAALALETDLLATRRALVERLPGRIQDADRILATCRK